MILQHKINIIVSYDVHKVIGKKDSNMLWRIKEDMKHFKELTSHNVIVMGRRTFESIGKPLPNRINIVFSKSLKDLEGIILVKSFNDFERELKKIESCKEIFIIGGKEIYDLFLPFTDKLYITELNKTYDGNIYFPATNEHDWKQTKIVSTITPDNIKLNFLEYTRK